MGVKVFHHPLDGVLDQFFSIHLIHIVFLYLFQHLGKKLQGFVGLICLIAFILGPSCTGQGQNQKKEQGQNKLLSSGSNISIFHLPPHCYAPFFNHFIGFTGFP